jgi:hypothetical protein
MRESSGISLGCRYGYDQSIPVKVHDLIQYSKKKHSNEEYTTDHTYYVLIQTSVHVN